MFFILIWYKEKLGIREIPATNEVTQKDLHKKLKRALAYMTKHPEKKITIAKLADLAHLSQYHFIRCFRSAYELTPLLYLREYD